MNNDLVHKTKHKMSDKILTTLFVKMCVVFPLIIIYF